MKNVFGQSHVLYTHNFEGLAIVYKILQNALLKMISCLIKKTFRGSISNSFLKLKKFILVRHFQYVGQYSVDKLLRISFPLKKSFYNIVNKV